MINKLNLLSVRSAKGTAGQLSRPAFARGLNNVPNTSKAFSKALMLFVGRIALPLTAVSNAFRRMKRSSRLARLGRLVCTVLLAGTFGLVLAGCGGGGGSGGGGGDPRAVAKIGVKAGEEHILVSWNNPDQANITGFNITWVNVGNDADVNDKGMRILTDADLLQPGSRVMYNITGLTNGKRYEIRIAVLYADGTSSTLVSVQGTAGMDPGDGGDPNFPAVSNVQVMVSGNNITVSWTNPSQDGQEAIIGFNINWINVDDNADANDRGMEPFNPPMANVTAGASVTYKIPNLNYDNTYKITVSVRYAGRQDPVPSTAVEGKTGINPDIDGDGLLNTDDNCPLDRNPGQDDNDTDGSGDACDDDDDNDGTKDAEDAFRTDACASTDTDKDGMPDRLVAGCQSPTGLTEDSDDDNDAVPDETDVDDNNNSLIEIRNLDQLALLRGDLNGDGDDDDENDGITAVGTVGCPSSGCAGYELTRSLNFSDADSYNGSSVNMDDWTDRDGSGWVPIGSCVAVDDCTPYTGIFDGRDYALADLFIAAEATDNGVGLFSAFNGSLQNLHLRDVSVSGGASDVGLLVGHGRNARYVNLLVTGGSVVSPGSDVGGLVGDADSAEIRYAGISDVDVSAGGNTVGGLAGSGEMMDIRYAYASDGNISGGARVGELVGDADNADIRYVYASGGSVAGSSGIGGLIGDISSTQIHVSYSATGSVSGAGIASGLFGISDSETFVNVSYWDTQTTGHLTNDGNFGVGYTTTELQSPTDFTTAGADGSDNIYADWDGIWCHPDTGEVMEVDDQPAGFLSVWDLGNEMQYPALNCMPGGLSAQGR